MFEHFQITVKQKNDEENTYRLKHNDMAFAGVSEMLEYYQGNPISHELSNIGTKVVYSNAKSWALTTTAKDLLTPTEEVVKDKLVASSTDKVSVHH